MKVKPPVLIDFLQIRCYQNREAGFILENDMSIMSSFKDTAKQVLTAGAELPVVVWAADAFMGAAVSIGTAMTQFFPAIALVICAKKLLSPFQPLLNSRPAAPAPQLKAA
jgi:hypothetical protein